MFLLRVGLFILNTSLLNLSDVASYYKIIKPNKTKIKQFLLECLNTENEILKKNNFGSRHATSTF